MSHVKRVALLERLLEALCVCEWGTSTALEQGLGFRSQISMSYVTNINEFCLAYGWFSSHIGMSHVTHESVMSQIQIESCLTYGWFMSRMYLSPVSHTDESCHTSEWVMSHIGMSHVTHMSPVSHTDESRLTYEWVMTMTHIGMSHVAHMTE